MSFKLKSIIFVLNLFRKSIRPICHSRKVTVSHLTILEATCGATWGVLSSMTKDLSGCEGRVGPAVGGQSSQGHVSRWCCVTEDQVIGCPPLNRGVGEGPAPLPTSPEAGLQMGRCYEEGCPAISSSILCPWSHLFLEKPLSLVLGTRTSAGTSSVVVGSFLAHCPACKSHPLPPISLASAPVLVSPSGGKHAFALPSPAPSSAVS